MQALLNVRRAIGTDLQDLVDLGAGRPQWQPAALLSALESAPSSLFVARRDKSHSQAGSLQKADVGVFARPIVVGALWANLSGDMVDVLDVVVAPAERRLGVGKALLQALQTAARAQRKNGITLEVAADNLAGIRLYERVGFKQLFVRRGYYRVDGRYTDALVYTMAC